MSKPVPLHQGLAYHIYNRGTNGEDLFREARNYQYFLDLYAKHVAPIVDTYAYCLLANHFHLLVRIKPVDANPKGLEDPSGLSPTSVAPTTEQEHRPDPSQQFSNLFNAYTKALNKSYGRTGSLFEHPFHRVAVRDDSYFLTLIHYIHNNPQKHGFVQDFREYPYSSYHALISQRPTRLDRTEVLDRFNGLTQFQQFHTRPPDERTVLNLIGDDFA